MEAIVVGKDAKIAYQQLQVAEYEECLRIPRQHYKRIEKLKFEELVEQKNEIKKKLTKKYGYDPTEKGKMGRVMANMVQMQMPDPSLPIHQQLEMVEKYDGQQPQGQNQEK